eukprot:EG_transcript_10194
MVSRWVTLVYSILISICASLTYIFGIYSDHLKTILHFNQEQITLVATLGNVAQFTGLPAGLVYDVHGPHVTLFTGGCLAFTGFALMYIVTAYDYSANLAVICLLYGVACFSMSWYDTSNVITNVHNFPAHRGVVIGMCKAFNGLGAGMFAQVYLGFFKPNSQAFLLLVPFFALAVALGGTLLVNRVPPSSAPAGGEGRYFGLLYGGTLLLAAYLAGTALAQELLQVSPAGSRGITLGMLALLLGFWAIPVLAGRGRAPAEGEAARIQVKGAEAPAVVQESYTLSRALRELDIWLLFLSFFLVTGVGLMLINNAAQLAAALAPPTAAGARAADTRSVLVSLLAVGSTLGRLGCGALSERLLHRVPRTCFFTALAAVHGLAQLWLAQGHPQQLFGGCLLAGLCYGGYWALMPAICADIFGVHHLGAIYNFIHFAPSTGALVLSTLVAGRLYDQEARRQGSGTTCHGPACYHDAFLINAAACLVAFVAAAWLQERTRFRYRHN